MPASLSLEMMAKASVLVDYYMCEEAMKVYTDKWAQELSDRYSIPREYCRNLMMWICIASVFGLREILAQATERAFW
jgi:hypothetical protein